MWGWVEHSQEPFLLSSSLLPSWHPRSLHQMFICLRGTVGEKGDWVSGEEAGQRAPWAESRACYVLPRSLCFLFVFPFRRLSFAFSALSSNVFLSPCCDDFSSVDFSHCRPLFPCFICLPSFCQWTFAGGLSLNAAPWLPLICPVLPMS